MPETQSSFEQNVARLERIIAELESDGLDLDESLRLFEEGVQRLREAAGELTRADERVKKLVEQTDGALDVTDLDA